MMRGVRLRMLNKQMERFKNIFRNNDGNNKNKIENLLVFVIILIITIVTINIILKDNKENKSIRNTDTNKTLAQSESNNIKESDGYENLKEKLEEILCRIDGVGDVKVLITYSQTSQTVALYNEDKTKTDTEEKDSRWPETEKLRKLLIEKK